MGDGLHREQVADDMRIGWGQGSNDPHAPVGPGWLRASHRKLDRTLSLPCRPYRTHDEPLPLAPDEPLELDIEIRPTCIVVPPGYRIGLSVRGKDDRHEDGPPMRLPGVDYGMFGVGPFADEHPVDRPKDIFGAEATPHFDPQTPTYVLPLIL